jgi:hypothetical protein
MQQHLIVLRAPRRLRINIVPDRVGAISQLIRDQPSVSAHFKSPA